MPKLGVREDVLAAYDRAGVEDQRALERTLDFAGGLGEGGVPFLMAEEPERYWVTRSVSADEVIAFSRKLIEERFFRPDVLVKPDDSKNFLVSKLAEQRREVFSCIFLDNRLRVILYEELFWGTINECAVFPREVAKEALRCNAVSLILAHNHPSGDAEPSKADVKLTQRLRDALGLLDIKVLDHIVVGGVNAVSLAERGLM